nr:aldehyde dehydrogenase family protein [Thermoactinospora rubra]
MYVDGRWRSPRESAFLEVENPATEQVIGKVPLGTAGDVADAVNAARRAFPAWSRAEVDERLEYLSRLRDVLAARHEDLARTVVAEVGAPIGFARKVQAGLPIAVTTSYLEMLPAFEFTERIGSSTVVKEPIGVVGAITPWNYPLHQAVAKVVPALAAGCTVVLKPAEAAPLSSYLLAEAMHDIGLPPGVFNLVPGLGAVAGEALAAHPDVDVVSFTGSTRTGRRIGELASRTAKRVVTELGGKSANLILPDADLHQAVTTGVAYAFLNSGQTCTAWTRMLVPAAQYDEAVVLAAETAEGHVVGDPLAEGTALGPLISAAQRQRVLGYIAEGLAEGARLVTGGAESPEGLHVGHYVRPTVFADVRPDMTIARQEIFGPVLSILPYTDEDEAIHMANDTIYGLAAAVWSTDLERAQTVARRLQAGQVQINGAEIDLCAPFGGCKQSGSGRELGRYGLQEFLQTKAIHGAGGH